LAAAGFAVAPGGAPGLLEAANRGAREAGGRSIGCNITVPREQRPKPDLDRMVESRCFSVRMVKWSYAFVVLLGGFGALDELFEAATLIPTGKIKDFPPAATGADFWRACLAHLERTALAAGTIDRADVDGFHLTDSPAEAAPRRAVRRPGRSGGGPGVYWPPELEAPGTPPARCRRRRRWPAKE
jgi:uncharacterized protein (TIGR00730 family)